VGIEDIAGTWQPWQPLLIIGLYILIVLGIALAARIKQVDKSEHDFFITSWKTGWVGISFSIAATSGSAGFVMGTIGAFYMNPPALTGYVFGMLFAPLVLWFVGRRLWPIGRRDGFITYTDFIGDFYRSERLRVVVSVLVVTFFAPYFAVNLMAPGLLLQALTGGVIPYWVGVILMAVIGTGYVLLGGMRAVIWTDIAQALVIYITFLTLIPVVVYAAGGFDHIIASIPAQSFTYDFSWNMWMLVVSWMVLLGLMQPSNPDRAFRLLAASSLSTIQRGAIASCVLLGLSATIAMSLAWIFRVLLPGVGNPDLVMPMGIAQYAMYLMPLFIVAVWAGGMSTLDSGLMACTSMLTRDVYTRNINPQASPPQVMRLSRILIVLLGIFATFVALAEPPFLWYLIGAAGGVAMQWLPAMLFGLYWRRANAPAAWAGILSGMTVTVLFQYVFTSPWPGPGGPAIMGLGVQVPLYVIVALLTKPQPEAHLERYQGLFRSAEAVSPLATRASARQEIPLT
jgi:solute:Na+ symporter, SSS family